MNTLIFSQSGIYRLQQLASQYYHQTGVRHKLSSPDGMINLLRDTADYQQREVRLCYDAFLMELNERQMKALSARGVVLREPSLTSELTLTRKAG